MPAPHDPGLDALLRLSASSWKDKQALREGRYAEVAQRHARWGRLSVPILAVLMFGAMFLLIASNVLQLGHLAASTGEAPTLYEASLRLSSLLSMGLLIGLLLSAWIRRTTIGAAALAVIEARKRAPTDDQDGATPSRTAARGPVPATRRAGRPLG